MPPATLDDLLTKLSAIDNHIVGLRSDFNAFFTSNLYWYALGTAVTQLRDQGVLSAAQAVAALVKLDVLHADTVAATALLVAKMELVRMALASASTSPTRVAAP